MTNSSVVCVHADNQCLLVIMIKHGSIIKLLPELRRAGAGGDWVWLSIISSSSSYWILDNVPPPQSSCPAASKLYKSLTHILLGWSVSLYFVPHLVYGQIIINLKSILFFIWRIVFQRREKGTDVTMGGQFSGTNPDISPPTGSQQLPLPPPPSVIITTFNIYIQSNRNNWSFERKLQSVSLGSSWRKGQERSG